MTGRSIERVAVERHQKFSPEIGMPPGSEDGSTYGSGEDASPAPRYSPNTTSKIELGRRKVRGDACALQIWTDTTLLLSLNSTNRENMGRRRRRAVP